MTSYVLDAGALVALQRDRRLLRALIRAAHEDGISLRTSAPALTEFLGGSPRRLRASADHLSSYLDVGAVDEERARRAAVLQRASLDAGARRTPGAIDALVAAEAEASEAWLIIDGDRAAFQALSDASGRLELRELGELV